VTDSLCFFVTEITKSIPFNSESIGILQGNSSHIAVVFDRTIHTGHSTFGKNIFTSENNSAIIILASVNLFVLDFHIASLNHFRLVIKYQHFDILPIGILCSTSS
jgi:hypothetical protein